MKEGWSYKKLGEVCEVISGQSPEGKFYNTEGQGTPFYQGKKEFSSKYIGNPTTWTTVETKIAEKDDLLMSVRAPVGDINFATQRLCIGRGLAAIRTKEDIDKEYLFYFLVAQKSCIKGKEGVGFASINRKEIMDIDVQYPKDFSEQRSIVTRLDAAFFHIDALKANAEKQLNEARKLFQAELTECMKPKEGWEEKRIKEVGEVIGGTTPSTSNPQFWDGDVCWMSPAELHGEHYLYDSVKKITTEAVEAKSLKELPIGTVILSSRAPIGKIAINKVPMYCNQGFKCVVCKSELYNEYLYWWFYGKKEYLNSLGTGATFLEISKTVVENIIIPIPPLDTQQAIVSHLDSLSSTIRKLEELQQKTIAECDALKQAMLREVFE